MPASVILSLHGPPAATLSGHAALGCFFDLVRRRAPTLSEALHANTRLKPFTLSFLMPASAGPSNGAESRFAFRVTVLDDRLAAVVTQPPADRVRIGGVAFDVAEVITDPARHAWADRASYEALRADAQNVTTARAAVLVFHTPTAFSSNVRNVTRLFPEPALVFRSLGRRWNAHAGADLAIDDGLLDALCEGIRVERYELETREVQLEPRARTKGFVGACEYAVARGASREQRQLLRQLAEFSFYAGVGLRTTMGMGQVTCAARWADG